jgi:hypothetical protein
MKMLKGEKWVCLNATCRSEFVVTVASGPDDGTNPMCCCGSKMKKVYSAPTLWAIQNPEASSTLDGKFQAKVR